MTDSEPGAAPRGPDDLGILSAATATLRWRRQIAWLAIIGALLGLVSGLVKDRQYASRLTFLPKGTDEAASGLALAASQFGVQLPKGSSDWWPAIFVELLNSRTMLERIALDTFVVQEEEGRRATLVDLLEIPGGTPALRAAQAVLPLRNVVTASEDKKLGAVKVTVATQWPSVSHAVAERLVGLVHEFNITTRQTLAAAEREFGDEQVAAAERSLRKAEDDAQRFLQRNRSVQAPELTFERDRLQREVTMRMQVYTSLMQNREQARLREMRNTPVITMLESPRIAVLPEKRGAGTRAVLGLLLGLLVGVAGAIAAAQASGATRRDSAEWREFTAQLAAASPRFLRRWLDL